MLELCRLACRNILRNCRRTAITLLSIVVGFAALASFGGFIEFSFEGLRESTIRTQLGHMQIYADGYWQGRVAEPETYLLSAPEEVEAALDATNGIATVTRRLTFSGLASVGTHTVNVRVTGVVAAREEDFTDFETLIDGRQLWPGDQDAGVIGDELRQGLGAEIGDWVTVMTTTLDGVINAIDFQLVGVVASGSREYDRVFVKIPLALAQRALETEKVERIIVLLDDTKRLPEIRQRILETLDGLGRRFETRIWSDLAGFYSSVVALYTGLFTVFALIVGVVVLFSVVNTMTMALFERTPEIGALRAIGARRQTIVWMFMLEGLAIGLLGSALGCAVAFIGAWLVDLLGGIPIPPPPGMSRGYQAYFLLTAAVLTKSAGVTMIAALISSIYPAVAASRLNIVEALQHA
ncbi:hypothetical protein NKDENANG_03617 [Candidatus Entotheonellaceae bacterium PAL068K]